MVARGSSRQAAAGKTPQKVALQRGKSKLAPQKGVPKLSTLSGLAGAGKRAPLSIEDVVREVQGKVC